MGEEKIPLDEYKPTDLLSAGEAKPSGRGGSEEVLLQGETETSAAPYEEFVLANYTEKDKDEKIPLDCLLVEPETHAIDLPESTLENGSNEDGHIFDEHDEQYPTILLRLQTVKEPSYNRLNTNKNNVVPDMETEKRVIQFPDDQQVHR